MSIDRKRLANYKGKKLYLSGSQVYSYESLIGYTPALFEVIDYEENTSDYHIIFDSYYSNNGIAFVHNNELYYGLMNNDLMNNSRRLVNLYYTGEEVLSMPINLHVTENTGRVLELSWVDINPEGTRFSLEEYMYVSEEDRSKYVPIKQLSPGVRKVSLNGFEQGELKMYRLAAYTESDTSTYAYINVQIKYLAPYYPLYFKATVLSSTSIRYDWKLDTTNPVSLIKLRSDRYDLEDIVIPNIGDTTITIENLQENGYSYYYLSLLNEDGSISTPPYEFENNRDLTYLHSPTLKALQIYSEIDGLRILWEDNSSYETHYLLEYKRKDSEEFAVLDTLYANTTSYIHQTDSLVYDYRIQALTIDSYFNANGDLINILQNFSKHSNVLSASTDVVTGLSQEDLHAFRLYPNPTNRWTQLESPYPITGLRLHSLHGSQIPLRIKADGKTLDVSNLAEGIYLLQIETQKGTVTKKLLIE